MNGKRLKMLREEKGLTQKDLAEKLSLTPKAISFYELGYREPSGDALIRMAHILGTTTDYLLGNSTSKEIPDSNLPSLTPKDERDIARDLENMIESLDGSAAMGSTEDDEDRELLRASLETAMKIAKRTAKKKFTPKKYLK